MCRMLLPSDTFQPASVSDLDYHASDLDFIRHNPPSFLGDRRREVAYHELHQQLLLRGQASASRLKLVLVRTPAARCWTTS
jgi:hypothetical protein